MTSIRELIEKSKDKGFVDLESSGRTPWRPNSTTSKDKENSNIIELPAGSEIYMGSKRDNGELNENIIDEDNKKRVKKDIEDKGIDALAYYVPFHKDPENWGIYIRKRGLKYLIDYLSDLGITYEEASEKANRFLKAHEEWHFHSEIVITQQELIADKPVYNKKSRMNVNTQYSIDEFEDALANANALREFNGAVFDRLSNFCKTQPKGYRDWKEVSWRSNFQNGCKSYFKTTANEISLNSGNWYPYISWNRRKTKQVPEYFDRDCKKPIDIAYKFSHGGVNINFHMSKDHKPPHFHAKLKNWSNKRRYSYPDLEPVNPTKKTLSNKEEKKIVEAIENWDNFESEYERHRKIVEDGVDPRTGCKIPK